MENLSFDRKERTKQLITIYQDLMPKRNWTDVKDIYELNGYEGLLIWGQNGRFYQMSYKSETNWTISMFSRDIYGKREWLGYGKGWVDKNGSNGN